MHILKDNKNQNDSKETEDVEEPDGAECGSCVSDTPLSTPSERDNEENMNTGDSPTSLDEEKTSFSSLYKACDPNGK